MSIKDEIYERICEYLDQQVPRQMIAPPEYPGGFVDSSYPFFYVCYVHYYVAWKKYGRLVNREIGEVVHFLDRDNLNCEPDNIVYITRNELNKKLALERKKGV